MPHLSISGYSLKTVDVARSIASRGLQLAVSYLASVFTDPDA